MGKPIATGNPGRNPERLLCCWPSCFKPTSDFPLCFEHSMTAWRHVNDTARTLIDHAASTAVRPERYGHVYFVRFRDRVKIGYTDDPKVRLAAIPHDEVLAVKPGTLADEKRCHAAFAHLREQGEWFRAEPELLQWAAGL